MPLLASLYLVPTPLDFGCTALSPLEAQLPLATIQTAAQLTHWVVENARTARAFLKRVDAITPLQTPLQAQHIVELPHHARKANATQRLNTKPLLEPLAAGKALGLLSEAGMPAVADAGTTVVRAAHTQGLSVTPLAGPNSIVLALAASGLNGQRFAFNGYLPQEANARVLAVAAFDKASAGATQIFIETPYRNATLLATLLKHLGAHTRLCVAAGLALSTPALVRSTSVEAWRKVPWSVDLKKLPAIFLFSRL